MKLSAHSLFRPPTDGKIWFPAKRYGYGWGLPCAWQGWIVVALYAALFAGGVWYFDLRGGREPGMVAGLVIYVTALSAILVYVCWRKGEKARWRWGGD